MLAALERLGTIAAVARELHLTAPGVSMQLAALEREVGLPLTERHGRTLALTPAGVLLARHGHDIVDRLSLAEMEVAALRDGAAGTYRLAAFPSAARTFVADAWQGILDDPAMGIRLTLLELEPQDALPALAAGDVDLAVTHAYSNMTGAVGDDFDALQIGSEPVWLAVRDHAADTADLRDFATHDWVVPHRQWACHEMVQRACGRAGFEPRAVAEATDFSAILALVAAGVGVALVPQLTVAAVPEGVRLVPLVDPVFRHDFVVARRVSAADPGVATLRGLLGAAAARVLPAMPVLA